MDAYPLLLDLTDRLVVVVGGGPVAARRAAAAKSGGAVLRVVSPVLGEDLAHLLNEPASGAQAVADLWVARDYRFGDLDGAWLVHTATGEAVVDEAVSAHAKAARIWCVNASAAADSAAWTPAIARGPDGVLVAVSGGGDPGRAQAVRDAVQAQLDAARLPVLPSPARRHLRASRTA